MPIHALLAATTLLMLIASGPAPGETLEADPLAHAFGTMPTIRGVQLSPDGSKISFLMMHETDVPVVIVHDLGSGNSKLVLASDGEKADLYWCEWASNERLLCGYHGIAEGLGTKKSATRLVAVDPDGSNRLVLMDRKLKRKRVFYKQYQDNVVDWLPDDPTHVLVQEPSNRGSGVSRIDIHSGKMSRVSRTKDNTYAWMSDGRGTPRLRLRMTERTLGWHYRLSGESKWHGLHESKMEKPDEYTPVGFGEDPNSLLVIKPLNGRLALFETKLANDRAEQLIFAHPSVDVGGAVFLGKYRRMVAVGYSTDMSHLHFFDPVVERITERLERVFPGKTIGVIDESWDKRFYLVLVGSDRDSGAYYRVDVEQNQLLRVADRNSELVDRELSPMQPIQYKAADGTSIPGYLTLPVAVRAGPLPAVILPHGGPESRDYWGFDWIAQYLAAKGYAVLQSNYRGSGGFGDAWAGDGGFQSWRIAMSDIAEGANHLVEAGIADPARISIVGWSYGGYAALMSGIVEPDRYRCIVSIAGVTDPELLIRDSRPFLSHRATKAFVSTNDEVLEEGSPLERAGEINAPVLLFHGDEDVNVTVHHSRKLAKTLKRKKKSIQYVEYEEVEHSIRRNRYRVDMLTRIGAFLDEHNRAPKKPEPAAD
jgi:dipeptidyl aminopeptidase/acylaminoacyl peptidase